MLVIINVFENWFRNKDLEAIPISFSIEKKKTSEMWNHITKHRNVASRLESFRTPKFSDKTFLVACQPRQLI